jgi:hypothetical protein
MTTLPLGRDAFNQVVNPCVQLYGPGPAGKRCKTCDRLYYRPGSARRYYKCPLHGDTHGAGTDHRVSWPACAKYQEAVRP